MASKKQLKQNINGIAAELFTECLFCRLYIPGVDSEKADLVLTRILDMQADFLTRASRPDGKSNRELVKAYYKRLKENLIKKVDEIAGDIAQLSETKAKNE